MAANRIQPALRWVLLKVGWRIWIILGFITAAIWYLIGLAIPERPDYYSGDIFYALITNGAGSISIALALLGIVSLCGALLGVIADGKILKVLLTTVMFVSCAISCCAPYVPLRPLRSLTDKDTIEFEANIYHLAVSSGPNSDFDSNYAQYIVYQCGDKGMMCHKYFIPEYDLIVGPESLDEAMRQKTSFVVDSSDHKLYLNINEKRFLVHGNQ